MPVTVDEKKEKLLSDFLATRSDLLAAAGRIPSERHEQAFLGTWTIKDLLAHLIGWDHANLEAIQAISEGRLPAFYAQIDQDWRSYNAHLVSVYKRGTVEELIANARASQQELVGRLTSIPAKDLFQDQGVRYRGYKVIVARLIQAETEDEKVHTEQVKEFAAKISASGGASQGGKQV